MKIWIFGNSASTRGSYVYCHIWPLILIMECGWSQILSFVQMLRPQYFKGGTTWNWKTAPHQLMLHFLSLLLCPIKIISSLEAGIRNIDEASMGPTWDSNRSSLSISCMYSRSSVVILWVQPWDNPAQCPLHSFVYLEGKEWRKTGPQVEYLLVTMRVK